MKRNVLIFICFVLSACHKAGGGDTRPQAINLLSSWDGIISVDGTQKRFYFLPESQDGDGNVTGYWNLDQGVAQGHFTGTINTANEFDFTLSEGTACTPKGTGTADVTQTQMNVSFSGHDGCNLNVTHAEGVLPRG